MARLALAALLCLALAADARAVPAGSTFLIDRPAGFGALPDDSVGPSGAGLQSTSDDGRFVVFESTSDGLLPAGADRRIRGVFLRDLQTGTVQLVSTSAAGAPANGESGSPSISADGTHVAFVSAATNLVPDAVPPGSEQVYVKDLGSGDVQLASRDAGGAPGDAPGGGGVADPVLDATGARVAFTTTAALIAADDNGTNDVYVRILSTATTTLASRASNGTVGSLPSREPSISDDGRFVAFTCLNDFDGDDSNLKVDIYLRDLSLTATHLVSRADGAGTASGDGFSDRPSISADGDRIAFSSRATDLLGAGGDTNTAADVFVRDRSSDDTVMVSRPDGSADQQGTAASGLPNLSADGVQVAFVSQAALVAGVESPPDGFHTYARAVGTTGTTLVSRGTGAAGPPADALSLPAGLSADGHLIAFNSGAGNLGGPGDDVPAVHLRDLSAETTNLVSGAPVTAPGAGDGSDPATSADGRFVTFVSGADGLSDADNDRFTNVYRRDTVTGALSLVSRGPSGAADGDSREPLISEDGRRVAFQSAARNLGTDLNGFDGIWVMDVESGTVELASRGDGAAGTPALLAGSTTAFSGDGRRVAFVTIDPLDAARDQNLGPDVYVRDLDADTTVLASRATGADTVAGNGKSLEPALSRDGSRVAFASEASDLGDGDTTFDQDVHVRDLATQTTVLASRATGPGTPPGDASSRRPSLSGDGSRVAFTSISTNIADVPTGGATEVYVRDLPAATTTLASREGLSGPARGDSTSPRISADGTAVAFLTGIGDPGPGDTAGFSQVLVRTLASGEDVIASRADGVDGAPSPGFVSSVFGLTADGGCVAFATAGLASGYPSPDFDHVYMRVLKGECPPSPAASPSPSPSPGPGPEVDRTKPVLSKVSLTRKTFRVGRKPTAKTAAKRGTTLRYTLSETARVRIAILRQARGKRQGKRCVKPTRRLRKAKRCTRLVAAGTLTRAGAAGANRVAFSGRVGKRKLKRGRYRLALRATDTAGNRSAPKTLRFRIVRR